MARDVGEGAYRTLNNLDILAHGAVVVVIHRVIVEYIIGFVAYCIGEGALVPVCQRCPGIGIASLDGIRVDNRNIGGLLCNRGVQYGSNANILCTAQCGNINRVLAVLQLCGLGSLYGLAVVRGLNGCGCRSRAGDLCVIGKLCCTAGHCAPLSGVRALGDNILRCVIQPYDQLVAFRTLCSRICVNLLVLLCGQLGGVEAELADVARQHGVRLAAAAARQQMTVECKAGVHGLAFPVADLRIKIRCIGVTACLGILVAVAAGCTIKAAGVLYPLAEGNAAAHILVVVPEVLAVIVVKANAVGNHAGLADCHAEQVVGAVADGSALHQQRVVVPLIARCQTIDVCPNHAGNAVVYHIVLVIRNFHIIIHAVQGQTPAAVVLNERRIAADDAVVALAGLILYDRGALNGAEHGNGLLCRVADLDGIAAACRCLVGKLNRAGLACLERSLLRGNGCAVDVQHCLCGAVLIADVLHIRLGVDDIAGRLAYRAAAKLQAQVAVGVGRLAEGNIDCLGVAVQLEGMRAECGKRQRCAQRYGLAGIQTDNALLAALAELIQPAVGAVVLDTHGGGRQTLADIGHLCGYRDSAVGLNGVRGDGNIAVRQLGAVLGQRNRLKYLLAVAAQAQILIGQQTVLDSYFEHIALAGCKQVGIVVV